MRHSAGLSGVAIRRQIGEAESGSMEIQYSWQAGDSSSGERDTLSGTLWSAQARDLTGGEKGDC